MFIFACRSKGGKFSKGLVSGKCVSCSRRLGTTSNNGEFIHTHDEHNHKQSDCEVKRLMYVTV